MPEQKIEEILERHVAFWNMEEADKPLLRISKYSSGYGIKPPPMEFPMADGTLAWEDVFDLKPEMVSPERLSPRIKGATSIPAISGDLFVTSTPYARIPWMEAIVGCLIRVSLQSSSMWSEPVLVENWHEKFRDLKPNDTWYRKLLEFTEYLSANSGTYLVSNTLMRGPSDMVDALISEENLCLGIYEHPEEIKELMMICGKIFVDVAQAQLDRIKPFQCGYCNLFGIWAPGTSIRTQDDASALVSAKHYKDFMLPSQEYIASNFDFSTIHLHSNSLHTVEAVLDSNIRAVQVSIDPQPYGPTVPELLPTFMKMQKKKPILIEGPMLQFEFDELLKTLSPKGLYVFAMIESEEDRKKRRRNK